VRGVASGIGSAASASGSTPWRESSAAAVARRSLTTRSRTRKGGQARLDMVTDPVRVPPFDRVDVHAVDHDAEVEVVAGGEAGVAGVADRVAARDVVAPRDRDRAQVTVQRE